MKLKIITVTSGVMLLCAAAWYSLGTNAPRMENRLAPQGLALSGKTNASAEAPAQKSFASFQALATAAEDDAQLAAMPEAWSLLDPIDDAPELSTNLPDNALENTAYAIRLDPQLMTQTQLSLSLPNGQTLNMGRHTLDQSPTGSTSWVGKDVQEPELFAVLTQNGDAIAGNIQTQDGTTFLITTLADGQQVIYQQDDERLDQMSRNNDRLLPPNAQMTAFDTGSRSTRATLLGVNTTQPKITQTRPQDLNQAAEKSTIQVLFVFTQSAIKRSGFANLQAQVDNEVVVANTITLPNSGVNMRIIPVGPKNTAGKVQAMAPAYAQNSSASTALRELTFNQQLNIEYYRNLYRADLVQGVITDNNSCGLAWLLPHDRNIEFRRRFGYSVIANNCISNSLLHEIGHNMGLDHDVDNSATLGLNHGYRYCQYGNGFRTMMAYPCDTDARVSAPRIKLISNPDVMYRGLPAGRADVANNAYILEDFSRHSVSRFK